MAIERTLSIIKPGAVQANHLGGIIAKLEAAGLRVIAARMLKLTPEQAGNFYAVHCARPFFQELVDFMTSGPVLAQVLEGDSAIAKNREVMGATDPAKAAPGTIRAEFGKDISENAVHGSDAADTAQSEIAFFFASSEICDR